VNACLEGGEGIVFLGEGGREVFPALSDALTTLRRDAWRKKTQGPRKLCSGELSFEGIAEL